MDGFYIFRRIWPWLFVFLPFECSAANCTANAPNPRVDFGQVHLGNLTDAERPNYRKVGNPRLALLAITCDVGVSSLQLRFTNLESIGNQLFRWGEGPSAGAVGLQITRATANGTTVDLVSDGGAPSPTANVTKNDALLSLDLTHLPAKAKNFLVEMAMTGWVQKSFTPLVSTTFTLNPRVDVISN